MSENSKDFGVMVCESLGVEPSAVRNVVVEANPGEDLVITLEVRANSEMVRAWAESQEIKNAGRVFLIEVEDMEWR